MSIIINVFCILIANGAVKDKSESKILYGNLENLLDIIGVLV